MNAAFNICPIKMCCGDLSEHKVKEETETCDTKEVNINSSMTLLHVAYHLLTWYFLCKLTLSNSHWQSDVNVEEKLSSHLDTFFFSTDNNLSPEKKYQKFSSNRICPTANPLSMMVNITLVTHAGTRCQVSQAQACRWCGRHTRHSRP